MINKNDFEELGFKTLIKNEGIMGIDNSLTFKSLEMETYFIKEFPSYSNKTEIKDINHFVVRQGIHTDYTKNESVFTTLNLQEAINKYNLIE